MVWYIHNEHEYIQFLQRPASLRSYVNDSVMIQHISNALQIKIVATVLWQLQIPLQIGLAISFMSMNVILNVLFNDKDIPGCPVWDDIPCDGIPF